MRRQGLPKITQRLEYDALPKDTPIFETVIRELCHKHNVAAHRIKKFGTGTTIVFAIDSYAVVKLFAPIFANNYATELCLLNGLHGRLPVSTPEPLAYGHVDGWAYLMTEQLHQVPLSEVWDEVSYKSKLAICEQVGVTLATLHGFKGPTWIPHETSDWNAYINERREDCVPRQKRLGLEQKWVDQIQEFVSSVDLVVCDDFQLSLLHTEIMREHVIVAIDGKKWRMSGLIDFEPSMMGHPEYEFA